MRLLCTLYLRTHTHTFSEYICARFGTHVTLKLTKCELHICGLAAELRITLLLYFQFILTHHCHHHRRHQFFGFFDSGEIFHRFFADFHLHRPRSRTYDDLCVCVCLCVMASSWAHMCTLTVGIVTANCTVFVAVLGNLNVSQWKSRILSNICWTAHVLEYLFYLKTFGYYSPILHDDLQKQRRKYEKIWKIMNVSQICMFEC